MSSLLEQIRARTKTNAPKITQTPITKGFANVFCWGLGTYSRLGQCNSQNQAKPVPVKSAVPKLTFTTAQAGAGHCLAIGSDGLLYTWGKCHFGQLGHGEQDQDEWIPRPVEALKHCKILKVASGLSHSFAITEDGVYSWGVGYYGALGHGSEEHSFIPKKIEFFKDKKVVSIDGGAWNSAAVTEDGSVYCWGQNTVGQLGNDKPGNSRFPVKVEGLEGVKFVSVSLGDSHVIALSQEGEVFTWGHNAEGQLGLGHSNKQLKPQKVELNIRAKKISAARNHSLLITDDGRPFSWGEGVGGKLGHGDSRDRLQPAEITALKGHQIVELVGENMHTAALTNNGKVYTCGHTEFGRLGNGSFNPDGVVSTPQLVKDMEKFSVTHITAGSNTVFCVVNED